jgi:hypothetical protein
MLFIPLSRPDQADSPQPARHFDLRNPPAAWCCVFVGIALAMPGTLAGLMLGLLVPAAWLPWTAVAGAAAGFASGFHLEGAERRSR